MPWRWPWYRSSDVTAETASKHSLREFVYLDEVSVYSLLASRSGPVPTDFTDTETESLKDEASSGLSLGVPGTKGELRSRMEAATSSSSQIVRKSSAQARFKQFLEAEEHAFVFSAKPRISDRPLQQTFRRGDLFEMDVELDADDTFRVSTTIASLVEILNQDGAQLLGSVDRAEMKQVVAFNRILERLLVGLVPIRATAVDYAVIRRDGKPSVVERSALDDLPPDHRTLAEPLFVVGFAEQDLFWKDLRTVLFGKHRFVLTGRVSVNAVQDRWSPVKMAEVLRPFMPDLADELNKAGRGLATAMQGSGPSPEESAWDSILRDALVEFARRVTNDESAADDVAGLLDSGGLQQARHALDGTVEQTREAFAPTAELLRVRLGDAGIDDEQIARHRSDVIVEFGLPPAPAPTGVGVARIVEPEAAGEWYLEAEVIALYW
jgi:hypothetical protein